MQSAPLWIKTASAVVVAIAAVIWLLERWKKGAKLRARCAEFSKKKRTVPYFTSNSRKEFLIEAYKKHSVELASIEDRLNKFLLVILGVFGAAVVAVPKMPLTDGLAWALASVVVALTICGLHYNSEIRDGRAEVRYLLVRCEIAMGFYTQNGELYTDEQLSYPNKGGFLEFTFAAVILAAAIGLMTLIFAQTHLPHALRRRIDPQPLSHLPERES
jgi:hypothetical protein